MNKIKNVFCCTMNMLCKWYLWPFESCVQNWNLNNTSHKIHYEVNETNNEELNDLQLSENSTNQIQEIIIAEKRRHVQEASIDEIIQYLCDIYPTHNTLECITEQVENDLLIYTNSLQDFTVKIATIENIKLALQINQCLTDNQTISQLELVFLKEVLTAIVITKFIVSDPKFSKQKLMMKNVVSV